MQYALQFIKQFNLRSLGVLLYTLVYGTMPFDGSNFKRLVRQISQGEYYEPKKPSSNLIYIIYFCSTQCNI